MKTLIILIIINLFAKVLTDPQLLGGILSPSQTTQSSLVQLDLLGLANVNVPNSNSQPTPSNIQLDENKSTTSKYQNQRCQISITKASGQYTCKDEQLFFERFDNTELNTEIWTKEIRIPSDYDDADFVSYQDLPENCYIKNKKLYILPTLLENTKGFNGDSIRSGTLNFKEKCTAVTSNYVNECNRKSQYSQILPPIVSARIGTRRKFSFRYGRIEIQAKLPKGDWLFPELILEPYSTRPYGDKGYASGQMRIAFIRSNEILDNKNGEQIDGYRLYGGVVVAVGEEHREKFFTSKLNEYHLGNDYHIYSMIWTNESITFQLDGDEYGKISGGFSSFTNFKDANKWKLGGYMAPFDREFYISFGVSAGGISNFPDGSKNSGRRNAKPWTNRDPKAELKFWNNRTNWYPTWNGEDAALKVDYVAVWAV